MSSPTRRLTCHLPRILRQRGLSWSDLARRSRREHAVIRRLRHRHANPALTVAYDVATALDLPVEALWSLHE